MAKKAIVPNQQISDAVEQHKANDSPNIIEGQFSEVKDDQQKSGGFIGWVKNNHPQQPSLMGQIGAMAREAVKDIRQTMNEVFFSKAEHPPEMGTPMNPTPQNVTRELGNFHGYEKEPWNPGKDSIPSPSDTKDKGRGR